MKAGKHRGKMCSRDGTRIRYNSSGQCVECAARTWRLKYYAGRKDAPPLVAELVGKAVKHQKKVAA